MVGTLWKKSKTDNKRTARTNNFIMDNEKASIGIEGLMNQLITSNVIEVKV